MNHFYHELLKLREEALQSIAEAPQQDRYNGPVKNLNGVDVSVRLEARQRGPGTRTLHCEYRLGVTRSTFQRVLAAVEAGRDRSSEHY